jgi:hypothetical protein
MYEIIKYLPKTMLGENPVSTGFLPSKIKKGK